MSRLMQDIEGLLCDSLVHVSAPRVTPIRRVLKIHMRINLPQVPSYLAAEGKLISRSMYAQLLKFSNDTSHSTNEPRHNVEYQRTFGLNSMPSGTTVSVGLWDGFPNLQTYDSAMRPKSCPAENTSPQVLAQQSDCHCAHQHQVTKVIL